MRDIWHLARAARGWSNERAARSDRRVASPTSARPSSSGCGGPSGPRAGDRLAGPGRGIGARQGKARSRAAARPRCDPYFGLQDRPGRCGMPHSRRGRDLLRRHCRKLAGVKLTGAAILDATTSRTALMDIQGLERPHLFVSRHACPKSSTGRPYWRYLPDLFGATYRALRHGRLPAAAAIGPSPSPAHQKHLRPVPSS